MSRPVSVSARELARWLRLDAMWLEQLAGRGELPAVLDRKGYLFDPRCLEDWIAQREPSLGPMSSIDLKMLQSLSLDVASGEDPEVLCDRVLDQALTVLGAECGGIFLSEDDAWLKLTASRGFAQDDLPATLEGVVVWSAANAEPLLLPDPRRVENIVSLDDPEPRDALAVPLVLENRVLGVLVVMRWLHEERFTQGHLAVATVLSTELALVVDRARMYQGLWRRLHHTESQLEAYAIDVREVFASEKKRAAELIRALDELHRTYLATVRGLAAAVEAKDEYTAGHLLRVTRYGLIMLEVLAPTLKDDPEFEYGFLLHDIGKLGVPDAVLTKNGPLSDDEWHLMRQHPAIGVRILDGIPFLAGAQQVVEFHHERWDGGGYPTGRRGEDIPMAARLFAVADAFDAMTTDRPYRRAMKVESAVMELRRSSGTQFWPDAVDALLSIPKEMLEVMAASKDGHSRG